MTWLVSTDNGFCLTFKTSNSPAKALLAITILSATSSGVVARINPFEVLPILCPDLPTLCTILLTSLGELYCMIKSVLPTSMPSSSDDVHINDFNFPLLKSSSDSILAFFEREP